MADIQAPEPHQVTHVDLLVELRVMQKELQQIRDALDRVTNSQAQEIKDLKAEIKDVRGQHDDLRIRMGQVLAVSALLALVLPIVVTASSPRVQFGATSQPPMEHRR